MAPLRRIGVIFAANQPQKSNGYSPDMKPLSVVIVLRSVTT
jgi:hypothetical protein